MKPTRESYFSHQRRQSSNNTLHSSTGNIYSNGTYPSSPSTSSFASLPSPFESSSSSLRSHKLRGIHINISSDPFQHRIPPYLQRLWQESRWKQYVLKIRLLGRRYYAGARLWQMVGLVVVSLTCICVILLFHVGFFSGKKYQDWERHGHRHLGDRREGDDGGEYMDELDLLDNVYPDAGKGLTALIVVLPPPSDDVLYDPVPAYLSALGSLCEYDIFGQVLIWNNHYPQVNLTMDQLNRPDNQALHRCPSNKLTIHNSSTDLKSTARYMACTMAKTPYCYFYDPLPLTSSDAITTMGKSPSHIRSVYANFLRSPTLVHGETINRSHYTATQWTWCFWYDNSSQDQQPSTDIHLHTCYTPPGTGIFVTKDMATTFIHQMELDPVDPAFADMYFTLWMNQGTAYLVQGSSSPTAATAYSVLTDDEMEHLQHGLHTLYNSLKHRNGIFIEQQQQQQQSYLHGGVQGDLEEEEKGKRHARAACHDDRCLFLTNVASLPSLDLILYQPPGAPLMSTVQDSIRLHDGYYSDQGGAGLLARYTYGNAVDGYDDSAWISPDCK